MGSIVVITLLLLAGSYGLSWWAKKQSVRTQAMSLAASVPLKQIAEDAASVAKEMGAGSFRQPVKIRGKIVCDTPLIAELSHTPCVSYQFSVTREYEEVLWEKDAEGQSVQRVHRKSEVVASNEASTVFLLDDGTSRIPVYPDHAKFERAKSHASFQQATVPGTTFGMGSFVLNINTHPGGTLGYRYEEHCLALDQEVTVVAEAGDGGGQLALRKPESQEVPFLVTTRTVDELIQGGRTLVSVLKGVSLGLAAVAVLIFLLGVIR